METKKFESWNCFFAAFSATFQQTIETLPRGPLRGRISETQTGAPHARALGEMNRWRRHDHVIFFKMAIHQVISSLNWHEMFFLSKSMHVKSYPVFRCFSWAIDFHFQDPKVSGRWYSRRWWYHGWNALSESIRTTLLAWTRRQFGFLNSHTSKAFKSYQQNKLLCRVSIVDVSAFFKSDAKCKFLPTQMWQCDRCIKW